MANEIIDITPLPDTVSELDLLKIELGQEKTGRLGAQKDALTLQLNTISEQFEKSKGDLQQLVNEMSMKYKVSGQDSYDKVTGKITRKTAVP